MKNPLFTSEIEETIINMLSKSTYRTTHLLEKVQEKHKISKQSFYNTLRRLKKAQIIFVNEKIVQLNKLWVEMLINFTKDVAHTYDEEYRMESKYLNLEKGERVTYNFKSIEEADIFWNHAVLLLVKNHDLQKPICVYNPHQWFARARYETEKLTWTSLAENGALLLCLIGGQTDIDKKTVQEMNEWHANVKASLSEKELLPDNRYVNIYGDIIIEMKMPLATSQKINAWFENGKDTGLYINDLQNIIKESANIKFTFSNNPVRAKKLSRQIANHFHIPKEFGFK
jgi:DNA-binding PadR family transcriptional regulator